MTNAMRQGSGAPDAYPFLRIADARDAACVVDLQVCLRGKHAAQLVVNFASPSTERLGLIDQSGHYNFTLGEPNNRLQIGNIIYLQWHTDIAVIHAGLDISKPNYNGIGLPVADRCQSILGEFVSSISFETVNGTVEIVEASLGLQGGFNTKVSSTDSIIDLDVTPGAGIGRAFVCDEQSTAVRSIGGVLPDPSGNVDLSGDSCIRVVPELVRSTSGYQIQYGRFILHDDCQACCRCEEKAAPWKLLKQLQERLEVLIERYQDMRMLHNERVKSIKDGKDCNTRPLLNFDYVPVPGGGERLFIALCNGSDKVLTDVRIYVSPLIRNSRILLRRFRDVSPEFFIDKKGIVEYPDDQNQFISLFEALRSANHVNAEPVCRRGYAYTIGGKNHLKWPGDIPIEHYPFKEGEYGVRRIGNTDAFEFLNDGGFDFTFDCVEPGDTRYFSTGVGLFPVLESIPPVSETGLPNKIQDMIYIVHSPTHPEINVVAKTGAGTFAACQVSEYLEDPEE